MEIRGEEIQYWGEKVGRVRDENLEKLRWKFHDHESENEKKLPKNSPQKIRK